MKNSKRFVLMILVVATIFSTMAVSASASVWRTGDFTRSGWTSYHTVYVNNARNTSKVKLHVYTCSRGTGHTGACRNKRNASGKVKVQLKVAGKVLPAVQYNANSNVSISSRGWSYYQIRFGGTTKYQHWGIEGTYNIRYIS